MAFGYRTPETNIYVLRGKLAKVRAVSAPGPGTPGDLRSARTKSQTEHDGSSRRGFWLALVEEEEEGVAQSSLIVPGWATQARVSIRNTS